MKKIKGFDKNVFSDEVKIEQKITSPECLGNKFQDILPSPSREGKKVAFTLAEVLITLTILGVVAAIMIPSLIKQQEKKELETRFKVAMSTINDAYDRMLVETGINYDYYTTYKEGCYYCHSSEFYPAFSQYFKISRKDEWNEYSKYKIKSFDGAIENAGIAPCGGVDITLNMFDKIGIGSLINCGTLYIATDTNGLRKGPNRLGYDVFLFYVTKKGITPYSSGTCSKDVSKSTNGLSCASYALKNQCPWDATKKYWECLDN